MKGRAASYLIVRYPKIAKGIALISILIGLCLEIFLSFRDGRFNFDGWHGDYRHCLAKYADGIFRREQRYLLRCNTPQCHQTYFT